MTYEPRTGHRRHWPFERQRLSDRSSLAVNVANGNLLLSQRDLQIAGTGLDLSVERNYNNLSRHHPLVPAMGDPAVGV